MTEVPTTYTEMQQRIEAFPPDMSAEAQLSQLLDWTFAGENIDSGVFDGLRAALTPNLSATAHPDAHDAQAMLNGIKANIRAAADAEHAYETGELGPPAEAGPNGMEPGGRPNTPVTPGNRSIELP